MMLTLACFIMVGDFSLVCIDTSANETCATYREVNPSKKARNFELSVEAGLVA